jgi:hypothetical protein
MSHLLNYLQTFLPLIKTFIKKRSKTFTCCAGCDELRIPLSRRFCVSLSFDYPVNIVLTNVKEMSSPSEIDKLLPMLWNSRLFMLSDSMYETPHAKISVLPANVEESTLHEVEDLTEFFVLLPVDLVFPLSKSLVREDFFTVNGIPLLFAEPGGSAKTPHFLSGPAARTKRLSALFADACAEDPILCATRDEVGYTIAFSGWAYAERHGVLAPSPFDSNI